MVQGWYQGGVSVFDFTDSKNPVEIAFFDRGPVNEKQLASGGYWSTYWYNGFIYGAEIARGLDVFRLTPSEFLTQNEIDAASQVRVTSFNAQQQPKVTWPATIVVARAYLDQLVRSNAIAAPRTAALKAAFDKADAIRTGKENGAAQVLDQLDAMASELEKDSASAKGRDQSRMRSLAATIKGRTTRLRG